MRKKNLHLMGKAAKFFTTLPLYDAEKFTKMQFEEKNLMGMRVGDYELLDPIGKGGMGLVYRAQHKTLGREVAVKVLPPEYANEPVVVERFLREARACARLNHPNIVQIFDVQKVNDMYCLVMELVPGQPMSFYLKKYGAFEEENGISFLKVACSALDCAHKAGIIHRDVKPDNFMLSDTGAIKLVDMGLVRMTQEEAGLTVAGFTVGTPYYISPEQIRGDHDVDLRSDIYSLGATMYHLLTGKVPFDGVSSAEIMAKHLNNPLPSPKLASYRLSNDICYIITHMMAKKREERYQRCVDVINDLRRLESRAAQEAAQAVRVAKPLPPPMPSDELRKTRPPTVRAYVPSVASDATRAEAKAFYDARTPMPAQGPMGGGTDAGAAGAALPPEQEGQPVPQSVPVATLQSASVSAEPPPHVEVVQQPVPAPVSHVPLVEPARALFDAREEREVEQFESAAPQYGVPSQYAPQKFELPPWAWVAVGVGVAVVLVLLYMVIRSL